jgi:tetratricopeptide (TPR) repeat protein
VSLQRGGELAERASTLRAIALVLVLSPLVANEVRAQGFVWPDNPENLQVLPEGTGGAELGQIMRGFSTSLNVRCEHCHVGEGPDLSQFDFPADDKPAKRKARVMLEMVAAINRDYLAGIADIEDTESSTIEVTCVTCHRGNAKPVMLEDILTEKIASEGVEAAVAEYRSLRKSYYGGFTYDFSAGMLTGLGEQLGKEGDFESAIRIIELELEINGESAGVYYSVGGVQAAAGLNGEASASFGKGMELAPDNWKPFFKAELDKLAAQPE